jgi:hypothetical protein
MRRALILLLALGGCPLPPPPEPPPQPEPGTEATCATVCEHWRELGCSEGDSTPGGATCEQVCQNVQDSNIVEFDLECKASVKSCDEIDACER